MSDNDDTETDLGLNEVLDKFKNLDIEMVMKLITVAFSQLKVDAQVDLLAQAFALLSRSAVVGSRVIHDSAKEGCERDTVDSAVDLVMDMLGAGLFFQRVGQLVRKAHKISQEDGEGATSWFDTRNESADIGKHAELVRASLILAVAQREMKAKR